MFSIQINSITATIFHLPEENIIKCIHAFPTHHYALQMKNMLMLHIFLEKDNSPLQHILSTEVNKLYIL